MAWKTSYYHYDAVGSARLLTDADQNPRVSYPQAAFGEQLVTTSTVVNPFRYVGQVGYYLDGSVGSLQVRQRVYDPVAGRWFSQDPARSDHNLFRYVENNPMLRADPSGLANFWNPITWGISSPNQSWDEFFNPVSSMNRAALGGYYQGLAQGTVNVVSGTQDAAISVLNLPSTAINASSYIAGSEYRWGYIPSPDWSENLIVEEDYHGISKILGGQGVVTLLTLGASQLSLASRGTTELGHVTSVARVQTIRSSEELVGRAGIFALERPSQSQVINLIRTAGAKTGDVVEIGGAAATRFRPIPVTGPISAWTRISGGYIAPYGSVNLTTGAVTRGSLLRMVRPHIIDIGAVSLTQFTSQFASGTIDPFGIGQGPFDLPQRQRREVRQLPLGNAANQPVLLPLTGTLDASNEQQAFERNQRLIDKEGFLQLQKPRETR